MSEMVERVARALCAEFRSITVAAVDADIAKFGEAGVITLWRKLARTAIATMREPKHAAMAEAAKMADENIRE